MWYISNQKKEKKNKISICFTDPLPPLCTWGTGKVTPLATVQVHCFELSSAPKEALFFFLLIVNNTAKFIPILEVDTVMDLGENKYLTVLKKGHIPAVWKQKTFFPTNWTVFQIKNKWSTIAAKNNFFNLRKNSTFNIKGYIAKTISLVSAPTDSICEHRLGGKPTSPWPRPVGLYLLSLRKLWMD